MIENITVNDKNGNGIFAEGIAYVQFLSSGKKYILYTMNEPGPNDTIKMYVGELTDTVGALGKISDEEWPQIRESLNAISHGEKNSNIQFMSMNNATFNIGIPKKLAITAEVKQAFKDQQRMGIISNQQQQMGEVPAVAQSTNGDFFNKEEVDETPAFTSNLESNQDQINIFNNPMKPEVIPMQSSGGEVKQEGIQGIEPQGGMQMGNEFMAQGQMMTNGGPSQVNMMAQPTPMPQAPQMIETQQFGQQPQIQQGQEMIQAMPGVNPMPQTINNQAMGQAQNPMGQQVNLEQPAVVDNPFISNSMPTSDNAANDMASALENASLNDTENIKFQEGLATNLSADLGIATGITPKDSNREVSKEEALEALEILNRYFKNTKELPSELASELNNQSSELKSDANLNQVTGETTYTDNSQSSMNGFSQENQNIESFDNNGANLSQEPVKTLALTPDNIPSIIPADDTNNLYANDSQGQQDMIYQNQNYTVEGQDMAYGQNFAQDMTQPQSQVQTGYVASSNGPAMTMSATTANINDVPVTLPDNYNPQIATGNVMMGPGSIPTENMVKAA